MKEIGKIHNGVCSVHGLIGGTEKHLGFDHENKEHICLTCMRDCMNELEAALIDCQKAHDVTREHWAETRARNDELRSKLELEASRHKGTMYRAIEAEQEFEQLRTDRDKQSEAHMYMVGLYNQQRAALEEAQTKLAAASETTLGRYCEWSEDEDGVWYTDCSQAWQSGAGGTPAEHWMAYCPFCGGIIHVRTYEEKSEEE